MITRIEVAREAGGAEKRGEVSSGGFAPHTDPGGTDAIFLSMGTQPAHGGFAILERDGKAASSLSR